jgi:hypothetical protein
VLRSGLFTPHLEWTVEDAEESRAGEGWCCSPLLLLLQLGLGVSWPSCQGPEAQTTACLLPRGNAGADDVTQLGNRSRPTFCQNGESFPRIRVTH